MGGGAWGALRCRPRGEGGDGERGGYKEHSPHRQKGPGWEHPSPGASRGPPTPTPRLWLSGSDLCP